MEKKETTLKRVRASKGFTQRSLSEATGISLRTIQHWEQGNLDFSQASALTVYHVAQVLGVEMIDLLDIPDFEAQRVVAPQKDEQPQPVAKQKRGKFEFEKLNIPVGAELEFIHDRTIKVIVADPKRYVLYNGEEWSLSALAQTLLKKDGPIQGTLHFSYNGETISDLRDRLEEN